MMIMMKTMTTNVGRMYDDDGDLDDGVVSVD